MSDETSALLGLPYIQAAQAQKHVTHNEALRMLDVLVQAAVLDRTRNAPPASPAEGDRHIVGDTPTGDWAGQAHALALFETGVWQFYAPAPGWNAYVLDEGQMVAFDGGAWSAAGLPDELGLNTAADATNRLAVSSEATLLTHDGAGHQLKINKASASETASLLFQSAFSGRAEMGLAGSNNFSIKVSDGSTWIDAMVFNRNTGLASGAAVQTSPTDTSPGRLARADYAYGPGNLLGTVGQSGGTPTGAVIEYGSNANGDYVRFADGSQICWNNSIFAQDIATPIGNIYGHSTEQVWTFPIGFSTTPCALPGRGGSSNGTRWVAFGTPNSNAVEVRLLGAELSSASTNVGAAAIGRWF